MTVATTNISIETKRAARIARIQVDISDFENNLKHFASGRAKPYKGEVAANEDALRRLRARLTKLTAAQ